MTNVAVPSIATATATDSDTLLGSQSGVVKRFLVSDLTGPFQRTSKLIVPSGDTTGATDDANFVAAHTALVASGGRIVLGFGTFYTKSPWTITADNIGVEAMGLGLTKLVVAAGWLSTTGGGGASIGGVIAFVGVNGFFCRRVEVDAVTNGVACNGIQNIPTGLNGAGTICTKGEFSWNKVRLKAGANYHIWNFRGQDVRIVFNEVDGSTSSFGASTQEGIELYGGKNVLIQGNTVRNIGNNGIYVQSIASATPSCEMDNIRVVNNYVEKCNAGVTLWPTYDATNGDAYLKNCIVEGNSIVDSWTYGIRVVLSTAGSTLENVQILNNTLRGPVSGGQAASRAISLENQVASLTTVSMRNIIVQGNQSSGCPLTDAGAPLYFTNFTSLKVLNNQSINTPTSGIGTGVFFTGCEYFEVAGNTIDGARQQCLAFTACSRFNAYRNVLLNFNRLANGVGAILVSSGTDFSFEDNDMDTDTVTSIGGWINVSGAGVDNFRVGNNRYRNKNSNIGTIGTYLFPTAWAATTAKAKKAIVRSSGGLVADGCYFECVTAGTTSGAEPTWNKQHGALTTDGTVVWVARTIH